MAEAAFKQMIATFIRQTRPQTFRHGKPPRYPQRPLVTAAGVHAVPVEGQDGTKWQTHALSRDPNLSSPNMRLQKLRDENEPRSFSSFLTDNYAREHNYLRISLTERCNLRCLYCMPEEGVPLSPPDHILTTPEIVYLSKLFVNQGVDKIRLTGGEPTVRKDILDLMRQIGQLRSNGLKELCITTNGISLHRKLDSMVESGLTGVNLSLDTLDPFQFTIMTRRNGHEAVMKSISRILEMNKLGAGIKLKINCVVMRGLNEKEIVPFVELGKEKDLEVRFIEYMPFDGNKWSQNKMLSFKEMLALIRQSYPDVCKVQDHANDTSKTYKVPGFAGRIGFITSMTHNFCGTCNRLRITSDGNLKVCLFGNSEVSLRDILRESNSGKPIDQEAMEAIKQIEMDRRETRSENSTALGVSEREAQLLDVIGMAVKRKKEKHAGMGELENMKNRPMILIDDVSCAQPSRFVNHQVNSPFKPASPFSAVRSNSVFSRSVPVHLLSQTNRPSESQQYRYRSTFLLRRTYVIVRRPMVRYVYNIPTHTTIPQSRSRYPIMTSMRRGDIKYTKQFKDSIVPAILKLRNAAGFASGPQLQEQSNEDDRATPRLTHLGSDGAAHMVNISQKKETNRSATAVAQLSFSNFTTYPVLIQAKVQKGDALAVARIAGIQAAKKTADLIPLAHPGLDISAVTVDVDPFPPTTPDPKDPSPSPPPTNRHGGVQIIARVDCHGRTGVEMEALTAATVASLTMYDMLKAVDKGMLISGARVIAKTGGKSGSWCWDEEASVIRKIPVESADAGVSPGENTATTTEHREETELHHHHHHHHQPMTSSSPEARGESTDTTEETDPHHPSTTTSSSSSSSPNEAQDQFTTEWQTFCAPFQQQATPGSEQEHGPEYEHESDEMALTTPRCSAANFAARRARRYHEYLESR